MNVKVSNVPVRVYETDELIMVAAPLPGLGPENIHLRISADRIVIQGDERGPRQHLRTMLLAEWTVGPYFREISLPHTVDPMRANASYGNGVLAISLPKAKAGKDEDVEEFTLDTITSTHGNHVGHVGSDMRPVQ